MATSMFLLSRFRNVLEFVKFSHTLFALPFALISMLVAAQGFPAGSVVVLILVCMVSARTAAMAFNRYVDWEIDQRNPRTQNRSRLVSPKTALALSLGSMFVFIGASCLLNALCALLSPVAIILFCGYSFTKRFTAFSHVFLGLALAAAPMGAWSAVTGELFSWPPWCLASVVLCWVWGFDLIYATQDTEFDRQMGLFSFPARYGIPAALILARVLHGVAWLILGVFGLLTHQPLSYWLCLIVVAGALVYEHRLCRTGDLRKINQAFFEVNAVVSGLLLLGVGVGIWIK